MKYINKEHVKHITESEFLTGIKQEEYNNYLNLPYEEESKDTYKARIALAITTKTQALTTYDNFIKVYDIADIPGVDDLKYEVLMKSLADNVLKEFSLEARQLLSKAFPVALGVLLLDDTLYYVFNLIVDDNLLKDKVVLGSEYAWIDGKNDFTFNEKLDTIIVPKLKFI